MEASRSEMENSLLTILTGFDDLNMKAFMARFVSLIDENGLREALRTLEAYNKQEGAAAPVVSEPEPKPEPEPEDEDAKVRRIMRITGVDWEEAWNIVRAEELEDGASICCSEECEGHSSAMSILVEAAKMGKKKRNARRRAEGRSVSDDEGENEKPTYVAPPRVRDADRYWPYARCKNIVKLIKKPGDVVPRNHNGLLEYIAKYAKANVDVLKKTHPKIYFKDSPRVRAIISHIP
jgi:hypothetical protein